jgi:two-component system, cell cycle response regulator
VSLSDDPEDDPEETRVANLKELQKELQGRSERDRAYLIVLAGSNVGEMYRLDAGETFLGRAPNVTIRLNDEGISRRHARLVQDANEVVIEDLKSANGTLVNGESIAKQILRDGDKIRLGSTTILKFTYHDHLDENFQQQMYDAALRDALTKAFNKKYFQSRLDTEIAYAIRHRASLSLVMFDVDHFKQVNDKYGHLAGDYVLSRIAKLTMSALRQEDVFARWGGEEFAVVCRGVALANAAVMAERLRILIEGSVFEQNGARIPITISAGVSGYPEVNAEASVELIHAADASLYEAKRGGRNRVVLCTALRG